MAKITVDGEGKATLRPDIATIVVGVITQKDKLADARKENNEAVRAIIDLLDNNGIPEKDRKTMRYQVQPVYRAPSRKSDKPVLEGHRVENSLFIKIRELDTIEQLIDSLSAVGGTHVGSLQFMVDDDKLKEAEQDARRLAFLDAKQKAECYCSQADAKLGSLRELTEHRQYRRSPLRGAAFAAPAATMMAESVQGAPVEAGEDEITVSVNVIFDIAKKELGRRQ